MSDDHEHPAEAAGKELASDLDALAGRSFAAPHGSAGYAHEWTITVKADELPGAMEAVWQCWEAWREGKEPIGGSMPRSMGHRMDYSVKKTKRPAPQTSSSTQ